MTTWPHSEAQRAAVVRWVIYAAIAVIFLGFIWIFTGHSVNLRTQ